MDLERSRELLLGLPHVRETQQWGDNLVFWIGDKTAGGKMFALANLGGDARALISFAAGPERFAEMVEQDGLFPAPYFARIYWVAAERWSALRDAAWREALTNAHAVVLEKMPKRARAALAGEDVLPAKPLAKKKAAAAKKHVAPKPPRKRRDA